MRRMPHSICCGLSLLLLAGPGAESAAAAATATRPAGAIRGSVYQDANGNGRRDAGEGGLGGVGVSDCTDLVLTAADGSYALPNAAGAATLVYVSIPSGYAKTTTWYRQLSADAAATYEFGLQPADETAPPDFVQVTDIHMGGKGDQRLYSEALAEIARLPRRPAFIVATGDLVNIGNDEKQFQELVAALKTSKVPVMNVPGNHDRSNKNYANYRKYLGPDYYSFSSGDYHFLVVNSTQGPPEQAAWITQDLKLLRGDKRLLVFQHTYPTPKEHKQFLDWKADAVFSGHWHAQQTVQVETSMRSYNTQTLLFGGIDCSPAGFKIVSLTPEGVQTRTRFLAGGESLRIVSPGANGLASSGAPIVVNAYQTSAEFTEVSYRLSRGGEEVASGQLKQEGDWSWRGELPELDRDSYSLAVAARNNRGETRTAEAQFMVVSGARRAPQPASDWPQFGGGPQRGGAAQGATLKPPLTVSWVADTGGTIDFGSPVLYEGTLYIGVKDRGDFERNGVLALDARTGRQKWFTPTRTAVSHAVAADSRHIYAVSAGGRLHVLNRSSGSELAAEPLGSTYQRFSYAAPVLHEQSVFAGTVAYFAAFDLSGKERWNQTYGGDWISCNAAPATDGKIILVPANWERNAVRAVSTADGKLLWAFPSKGEHGLHGSPVMAGDRVVFTTYGGGLIAAALADGRELWRVKIGEGSATTPAVLGDIVVAGATGKLQAHRLSDGKRLWSVPLQDSPLKMSPYNTTFAALAGSPTISGGTAWLPAGDGRLYAVALDDGKAIWSMDFGTPILSAPCISGNALYLTTYDGHVYALTGSP